MADASGVPRVYHGPGMAATARVRAELPGSLRQLGVRRLLDVPCGDFHRMLRVDLAGIDYIGGDIIAAIVAENQARYRGDGRRFVHVALTTGMLPAADAVLCRDCLVHLSFANIVRAYRSVWESGARYLIATTFPRHAHNVDVIDGDWRPLNLDRAPFFLPPPRTLLVEGCDEQGVRAPTSRSPGGT